MRIAVCDDDNIYALRIKDLIEKAAPGIFQLKDNCRLSEMIDIYNTVAGFEAADTYYDIVFMDIFFADENSISILSETKNDSYSCMVFVTTSCDYAVEAFALNAVHYIVKPVEYQDIREALDRCRLRLMHNLRNTISIASDNGVIPIELDNLVYIEIFNKTCFFHTIHNVYKAPASLSSIEKELDTNGFMRVQRSYIVNMRHITDFFFDHIILSGGTEITLSRRNRCELKKQYLNYMFNLARNSNL